MSSSPPTVYVPTLRQRVEQLPTRARCTKTLQTYLNHILFTTCTYVATDDLHKYADKYLSYECQQVLERELWHMNAPPSTPSPTINR